MDERKHHIPAIFLMRVWLTYLMVIGAFACAVGQGGSAAHIKTGDRYFNQLSFAKAVVSYQTAVDQGAVNEHVTSRLAECYLKLNQPEKAEYWYATVVKFLNIAPINYYHYAEALKCNGKYDEAEKWMDKYLTAANVPGSKRSNISDFARKFPIKIE